MKIGVGVAGCGYWGPNLLRNFKALADARVVQVCDRREERLAHMKDLYSDLDTTTSYDELIGNPDISAIAIATPVSAHFDMASKSLKAGKHTIIEKPMAASSEQCHQLIELANERGLVLMVGHTFIYTPVVRRIKEIIQNDGIGEIMYISTRRLNLGLFQKDINVAWDLAPHDISIILYFLDQVPVAVNCQGKAHITGGVEDVTNMSLRFSNGGFATIQSSWLDPNKVREMTIVGSRKMIVYNDIEPIEKIRIYDKRVEKPDHYDTFAEFHYSYHYGDMLSPYVKQTEPLRVECQHFIDCIKNNGTPETSGIDGLRVVQILEAASESLRRDGALVSLSD